MKEQGHQPPGAALRAPGACYKNKNKYKNKYKTKIK
jgi:hypothetical protein